MRVGWPGQSKRHRSKPSECLGHRLKQIKGRFSLFTSVQKKWKDALLLTWLSLANHIQVCSVLNTLSGVFGSQYGSSSAFKDIKLHPRRPQTVRQFVHIHCSVCVHVCGYTNQWPFQEPKLEVRTIYKAYVREYPHKIWPYIIWYSTSILGSWNSHRTKSWCMSIGKTMNHTHFFVPHGFVLLPWHLYLRQ